MVLVDLTNVQSQGDTVPAGKYPVSVSKAELADTRSGGKMIKVQFKILEGPQENRVVFNQFNIQNASPEAQKIGLGQLKQMMIKFGHQNPNQLASVTELIGLKGQISVKIDDDDAYGPQARVTSYSQFQPTGGLDTSGPGTPKAGSPF